MSGVWGDLAFEYIDGARLDYDELLQGESIDVDTRTLGALVGIGYALMDIADAIRGDKE